MEKVYTKHIKSSHDLETTYPAVRAGFVALALEKNRRATPFVEEARALKEAASEARSANDLLKIDGIRLGLITAAGVSDKAATHLTDKNKLEAVEGLIKNFLEPSGENFVEELVFRFLLTRGDTLGGAMRNVGGFMAQKKLTRSIIACLKLAGKKCVWLHSESKTWLAMPDNDADVELYLSGLAWRSNSELRTLVYNQKVPLVQNNVDLLLLRCSPQELNRELLGNPAIYLALGELKGGIDPAGADEHWKTASSALSRIRTAFKTQKLTPHLFFIGAAIEKKMAEEIWTMLEAGDMENAANLTDEGQIASISRWLSSL